MAQLANSGVNDAVRTTTTTRVQSRRSPTLTACHFWQPRFRVWSCLRSPRSSSAGHRIDGHPPLRARSQRSLVRSVNPSSSRTPRRVTGGHGAAAAVVRESMPNRTTCLGSRRAARRAGCRSLAQPTGLQSDRRDRRDTVQGGAVEGWYGLVHGTDENVER